MVFLRRYIWGCTSIRYNFSKRTQYLCFRGIICFATDIRVSWTEIYLLVVWDLMLCYVSFNHCENWWMVMNNNHLFYKLQSSSKVLGRLPFLPLLFLPPPAPGPMLIKTLMFVRVIVLLYPNIEQGGRGIFSKRENSLFSGLKWTTVKLYSLPNYFCLWL